MFSKNERPRLIVVRTGITFPLVSEDEKAGEVIYPGHLVGYNSDGDLIKHDDEGGTTRAAFALERDEMGKDIDQPYAVGDQVKIGSFQKGHHVLAFVASGTNVAKGDPLESAGDGRLQAVGSGQAIAISLETLDNSDGADTTFPVAGDSRIIVEII